ncbi:hypothetical protein EDC04DRAFT_2888779 [Pisolithus marmoratus]|nr:hypothetical protein EDC04DRAFT_2888779 [Pisolithus marmoratus]
MAFPPTDADRTSAGNIIEMEDLSQVRQSSNLADNTDSATRKTDASVSIWAWTSASIFAAFSLCLMLFPRFLLFLADESGGRRTLTFLEKFLALQLGIMLGVASLTIVAMIPTDWPTGLQHTNNSHPLLWPVTATSLAMALASYGNPTVSTLATTFMWGTGAIGFLGLWLIIFEGSSAISRKTGADKHTSAFIFGNKNAASVKKRKWKNEQAPKNVL